ncbi:MAG: hypothetical protein ACI853_001740, partial [Paracoccaceae bacterium]
MQIGLWDGGVCGRDVAIKTLVPEPHRQTCNNRHALHRSVEHQTQMYAPLFKSIGPVSKTG